MFITLLVVDFIVSFAVCFIVAMVFRTPVFQNHAETDCEDISHAWSKYLMFAIYVVGISGGVRIWDLEKYITPAKTGDALLELTSDRWVLEIYRTIIGTLESNAWMLLVFFVFALLAYVIVKGLELRKEHTPR